VEFINKSKLEFVDISAEKYRTYLFPYVNGALEVRIDEPRKLHVGENGHRIFDGFGVSHYVPNGWILLSWEAKTGAANFDF
jgi:hypothetical protein